MPLPPLSLRLGALAAALLGPLAADPLAPDLLPRRASSPVPLQASAFRLQDVRLLEGPFRDAEQLNTRYLLSLDPDRLLHTFRLTAGLPTSAPPYGGWEDPKGELRGHSLGHYLSACALTLASTGDERLRQRLEVIVSALEQCQAALPARGYHAGFLSAYPEEFFDRVYARQPVWAPYYTLHKIMAGLLDAWQYAGNPTAREVLLRLTDWVKSRVDAAGPAAQQAMLDTEFGGMNEVLANLYAVTGDPEHLRLARAFDHRKVFDPLAQGRDALDGLHANTQIPKLIGAAREYELTGEPPYADIARFSWERIALHRSYVIGGHSDREHFFPVDQFARHLGTETCETCNTYNLLKLTRHLFAWKPDARLMDFYERALFNHILASQEPGRGLFGYFMSLKPGHFKTYSTPEDSFWCCVGTGMENHAKYGESVYFRSPDTLWVNLFIASEVRWREKDLVVRQATRFPDEGRTTLSFQGAKPGALALEIRWPSWASSGLTLRVNGEPQPSPGRPGSYVRLNRTWNDGDRVEIEFPLPLRLEELPGAPNHVAFLQGPIVLAGELGTQGLPDPHARRQTEQGNVPSPEVPVLVGDRAAVLASLQPGPRPLTHRTHGLGRPTDVLLSPYFRLHHQRYNVYWQLCSEAEWQQRETDRAAAERQRQALEARILDEFHPGEPQSETDHHFQGERTRSGTWQDRKWRDASDGGWFSFDLRTGTPQPLTLRCTYWGSDGGLREFDLLVEGRKIATQILDRARPGEFIELEYPIPTSLLQGRSNVTVRLQAHPGRRAGGLFGARLLRAETGAAPAPVTP